MKNAGDSMAEGLKKIVSQIGTLMVLPDADPQFLNQLQAGIVGYLKQSAGGPAGAGGPPGGGTNQVGPPDMGGQSMAGGPGGPGMGGAMQGSVSTPNPDELRRIMGADGGTQ